MIEIVFLVQVIHVTIDFIRVNSTRVLTCTRAFLDRLEDQVHHKGEESDG